MMNDAERSLFMDMEGSIDRLKAFSDILMSTFSAETIPDNESLYEVAGMMYTDAKTLREKYNELCSAFHEVSEEKAANPA